MKLQLMEQGEWLKKAKPYVPYKEKTEEERISFVDRHVKTFMESWLAKEALDKYWELEFPGVILYERLSGEQDRKKDISDNE